MTNLNLNISKGFNLGVHADNATTAVRLLGQVLLSMIFKSKINGSQSGALLEHTPI